MQKSDVKTSEVRMSIPRPEDEHQTLCSCFICRDHLSFEMPNDIVKACQQGRLVIFAGAGISTESRHAYSHTFYSEVESVVRAGEENLAFPDLMSRFEDEHGRGRLLQKIQERFDYISSFPELKRGATRFHRELATLYSIETIITTNWDTYFEEICGAVPVVIPEDYAFWQLPGRKVFKIHGSISNLGSVVATRSDYEKRLELLNRGAMGGTLRHLLATSQILFVGYSFRDDDFREIFDFIRGELGAVLPRSFIVTPDERTVADAAKLGLKAVRTDGSFFLRKLKAELVEGGELLDDSLYQVVRERLATVQEAQRRLVEQVSLRRHPAAIFSICYQDGWTHALERIVARQGTGEYSNPHRLTHAAHSYDMIRRGSLKKRRYWSTAYVEGYLDALIYCADEASRRFAPLFFLYRCPEDLTSFTRFRRWLGKAESLHKASVRQARRLVNDLPEDMVVHHPPYATWADSADEG